MCNETEQVEEDSKEVKSTDDEKETEEE